MERKWSSDSAHEPAVEPVSPSGDALTQAEAHDQGYYEEYLRSLEELPMLVDVVREPPRAPVRDFRLGQRPDVRKAPREDVAALRERHARELAELYAEYVASCASLADVERVGPRKAPAKHARKASAQKKRAKRAKRSARSKA